MKNLPIKLLVLEEDEHSFAILRRIFSQASELSFGLDWVRDIPQALQALKRERYDACVLNCGESTLALPDDLVSDDCFPLITILLRAGSPQAHSSEKKETESSKKGKFQARLLEETVKAALAHSREVDRIQRDEIRFWANFMMDPIGLALVDAQGQVLFTNEAFRRMLGYDQQESARLELRALIHPDEFSEHERSFRCLMAGTSGQYQVESRLFRKNGSWVRVRETGIGLVDPETSERRFVLLSLEEMNESEAATEREGRADDRRNRMSRRLSNARESERKLIAQELHDSLGACLSAIKYALEKNLVHLQKTRGRPDVSLGDVIPLVQSAIEETRRISANLWPSILDDQGIAAIIHSFCSEFSKTYSSIEIEKIVEVADREIDPALKIVIYRILQEALNNVARHSRADMVKLSLVKKAEQIELLIADNGCGFEEERVATGNIGSMGLASMRNRVEISGGAFSLETGPGVGTTVRAVWPVM